MINLIGAMPPRKELLAFHGLHLHDYAKAPRPGRKLGHCTLVARTRGERDRWARGISPHWPPTPASLKIASPEPLRIYAPQCGVPA